MLLVTFIDTVWFYATPLSVFFWIFVGALPTAISPKWLAVSITSALLVLEGTSMATHNWAFHKDLPTNIKLKKQYRSEILSEAEAEALKDNGVQVVCKSHLFYMIPVSYASSFDIRPISIRYNRFPLTGSEISQTYITAVNASPTDPWGEEGLNIAASLCEPIESPDISNANYIIYSCTGQAISQES